MNTRRRSREFLLQSLYARSELGSTYDREKFIGSFFSQENHFDLEIPYVDSLESVVILHENELLQYIALLAPKFDLSTLPLIHILILMITL
jgi:transcription termination factor NusB